MKLLASAKEDVDQNENGENVTNLSTNLLRLFWYTVIFSITIINKHLTYCLLLYLINNLGNQSLLHLVYNQCKKPLMQNFNPSKYS